MLPPDPTNPLRMPAPSPCRSCVLSKIGWITALVASLAAVFFFFRQRTLLTEVNVANNNAELSRVEIKALNQQLYAERILAERQIASLKSSSNDTPKTDTLIFAHLTPPDTTASGPTALVVWLPNRQTGILCSGRLPVPNDGEELRLWIEESNAAPVSAGVIAVGSGRAVKSEFKPAKPLGLAVRFTVTLERKGNVTAPSGPILMSGAP